MIRILNAAIRNALILEHLQLLHSVISIKYKVEPIEFFFSTNTSFQLKTKTFYINRVLPVKGK